MIKVLYGENLVLSRNALLVEIDIAEKNGLEVIRFEGKNISLTELTQVLESKSLFGSDRLVIIENLFSLPKSKEKEKIFQLILKNLKSNLFIWEGKDLTKSQMAEFEHNFIFQQFKISSVLFKFLDSLKPNQKEANLQEFHSCLAQEVPEMIFAMLIRQIRLLILAKEGEKSLGNLAPWQKNKFISQAKSFETEKLKEIYQKLLEIDFQQKTSGSPFDLAFSLDLLIAEI